MALPIRKGGNGNKGGYLHGVSGAILSIVFASGKSGKTKNDNNYTAYSLKVTVRPDGSDAPKQQYLNAGFLYGDNAVAKDGKSIEGKDDYSLDGDTQAGKFITSLVEGDGLRFPEDRLGTLRNYDAVANTRVKFARIIDEATTERIGKRKDEKTGREYPQDHIVVAEVIALPEPTKGGKKTTGTKTTAGKSDAAPASAPAAAEVDTDTADAALIAIVAKKGGTLDRAKMSSAVVQYRMSANLSPEAGEALRKVLISDNYIAGAAERDIIVLSEDGKTIAAAV